jgi:transglutaminase-like putative cysteine protease
MSRGKKVPPPKKSGHTRRWIIIFAVAVIIVTVLAASYILYPAKNKPQTGSQSASPTPGSVNPAFAAFTSQYIDIMKNLNSSQTKNKMLPLVAAGDNQTQLFSWVGTKLTFAADPTGTYVDPFQILSRGEGVCLQWSVVYVSACLALGYQARLCVAVNTAGWSWIHVWAEDYYHGQWVPVDPSDKVWNQPHRYLSWGWGDFGTEVKVYAFTDASYQDVTATYA